MKKLICLFYFIFAFAFVFSENIEQSKNCMNEYSVIYKPSFMIIGIECRTKNGADYAAVDIPAHWEKFKSQDIYNKVPNKVSDECYGLYTNYESDHMGAYSLIIGYRVSSIDEIPEGMVGRVIPESAYAVFDVSGEFPKSLIATWEKIWSLNLNRAYTGDFELYTEKFMQNTDRPLEVYISIK